MKNYFLLILFAVTFHKPNAQNDVSKYLELLKNARDKVFDVPGFKDTITTEYQAISNTLEYAINGNNKPVAMEMVHELTYYWELTGKLSEGRKLIETVLQLPVAPDYDSLRALVLMDEGYLAFRQGDNQTAKKKTLEAKTIFERLNDQPALTRLSVFLAQIEK